MDRDHDRGSGSFMPGKGRVNPASRRVRWSRLIVPLLVAVCCGLTLA